MSETNQNQPAPARQLSKSARVLNYPNALLTDKDVAALFSCGVSTVWRWASNGTIPKPVKIGGVSRWRMTDLAPLLGAAADNECPPKNSNDRAKVSSSGAATTSLRKTQINNSNERWGPATCVVSNPNELDFEITVNGRVRWVLVELLRAGYRGLTSAEHPGTRLSDYVRRLRALGVRIDTLRELHDGPFPGVHGRYVLRSRVRFTKEQEDAA